MAKFSTAAVAVFVVVVLAISGMTPTMARVLTSESESQMARRQLGPLFGGLLGNFFNINVPNIRAGATAGANAGGTASGTASANAGANANAGAGGTFNANAGAGGVGINAQIGANAGAGLNAGATVTGTATGNAGVNAGANFSLG
ncbi:OLC1v1031829C1 [Oldenlandia corymbosa var. corymbosa]|uniref:OLC1v1031829C1 n=1 Tax=Oldenlandia corymbosa var. corymbosa TaxID=529605 RepID=A0AAV1CL04_OLDCO|nr:OLC1v1031829C1 [Oldenlandia corymbosa var. corymbosa]